MAVKKGSRTWYPRVGGGLHLRIWFAKAGRGTVNDTGIAPPPEQQLKNGTYSFNLSLFDPTGMTLKEAAEAGKETSLYPGFGAQFGAQIWRMANEAQIGDYIFLESENHHLHAVGLISGNYLPPEEIEYTADVYNTKGIHRIPVKWVPIKDGIDYIQLGRLDNAIFRDVVEKDELASLLVFGTEPLMLQAMGIDAEEYDKKVKEMLKELGIEPTPDESLTKIRFLISDVSPGTFKLEGNPNQSSEKDKSPAEFSSESQKEESITTESNPPKPLDSVVEDLKPVIVYVARSGTVIHDKITEQLLHELIKTAKVLNTDHVYHPTFKSWIAVSEYCKQRGLGYSD